MKKVFYPLLMLLVATAPALANVTVSSPTKGDHLSSPFLLSAYSTSCSSQPVQSMGYSFDNSRATTIVHRSSIDAEVKPSAGTHTLHVKSWGIHGAQCVADVKVTVTNVGNEPTANASSSSGSGISIGTPSSGEHVSSPFTLSADASSCKSQSVRSIGYSLDNSSDTTWSHGSSSLNAKVSASAGTHTVHVKSWTNGGASCSTSIPVTVTTVTDDVTANSSIVPSNATHNSDLEVLGGWSAHHDSGARGSSSGSTKLVGSPSRNGKSRKFSSSYRNSGAMRYSVNFGDNRTATNFMYDAWVYLTSSASHISNLEMDVNQTMPNGQTVIFGVQCDSPSGSWDYTENLGSARHPKGHWAHSGAGCNLHNWSKNAWHHIQISYSRTSSGRITYKYVYLDGHKYTLNHTVFGARDMGWGSNLSTNFQVDGSGSSGSSTIYLDNLTIYRW